VPNKRTLIYPVQVVEELTKKTLTGTATEFVIRTGGQTPQNINLQSVDGEYFESAENAKSELTARAIASIAKMVASAEINAAKWYDPAQINNDENKVSDSLIEDKDDDEVVVTKLPDGTMARVTLNKHDN
jgi:hypothetical protein